MAVDVPAKRNPLLGPASFKVDDPGKPPTQQQGSRVPHTPMDWASFLDEAEQTPDLTFPSSIRTYHTMRTDSQIDALHAGTVSPIKEFRWSIDTNGCSAKIAENAAADLGLPLKGEEDEDVPRKGNRFVWDDFLNDALLAPLYGFFDFETVGEIEEASAWRMRKMVPLHPRYTEGFKEDDGGELLAIRQTIAGPRTGGIGMPEPIPASHLVRFVWRAEAGSHIGRSMLRSMFREWAIKDRVIRVAAINIQRAGGIPVIEGAPGASNEQLADLAKMARQFKVADGGGGSIPFGTKLNLVGGSVPEAVDFIKYCDEAMARVWALMLVQLGMTNSGSRALGAEFAIYAARAQRAWAKWIAASVNDWLDRYVEWNDPFQTHAPLLCFEQAKPEQLSLADLVALIEAGAITVDPELEEWIRSEGGLPEPPEPPEGGEELGALTPEEVELIRNKRNPPALPAAAPAVGPDGKPLPTPKLPSPSVDPTVQAPTFAGAGAHAHPLGVERVYGGVRASLTLPARELRRAPSANEIRAAVDFRGLDEAHNTATTKLQQAWLKDVLPEQIATIGAQIRGMTELTKAGVLDLSAPRLGDELLLDHLGAAAVTGAKAAKREMLAQGKPGDHVALVPDTHEALVPRIADQAAAIAKLNANALSLAAQRKAQALVSAGGRDRNEVAALVEEHLTGQKHVWEREQLRGAVTMAQNQGRITAFESQPDAATASYEASELLDDRTCDPCAAIDGTVFDSLEEASEAYAGGGYVDCEGGPNCRGTLIAVYPEQNTEGGGGRLNEPSEPTSQPEPTGAPTPRMTREPRAPIGPPLPPVAPPAPPPAAPAPPSPAPPPPAPAAEAKPEVGHFLGRAQAITSHDEAVSLLKDEMGIPQVDFGEKMRRAMTARAKPGSQAEMNQQAAMSYIKQMVESIAEVRDVFGDEATRVDAVYANSVAKQFRYARGKGIGSARAAVRSWPSLPGRTMVGGRAELIFNDGESFSRMIERGTEETGGHTAKADNTPRGFFMHEMGHVLERNLGGFISTQPRLFRESGLASSAERVGTARFISRYATSQTAETWAESFATLMTPGGVAEDFGFDEATIADAQARAEKLPQSMQAKALSRITELRNADADTKASLTDLRERFNAWLAEEHPDVGHMPER